MYAVTGGVPKYIELFSARPDIYQSIQDCILNPSGYLYDEPHFLLQQEVTEIGSYFSIIKAIAAGNSKLSAIATVLELKATGLNKIEGLWGWMKDSVINKVFFHSRQETKEAVQKFICWVNTVPQMTLDRLCL